MIGIGDANGPGFEPTRFVVDAVAGEVLFCDKPSEFSFHDDCDDVVERVLVAHRQSDGYDHTSGVGQEFS